MTAVREPAVAGTFYCADGAVLGVQIDAFLEEAEPDPQSISTIVVPHAGYVFSGAVAGRAYGRLRGQTDRFARVAVLGPAHRQAVLGLALPGAEALRTPLGEVRVDEELVGLIEGMPQVCVDAAAHRYEHSLEVQLPFIQRLLPGRPVLPLLVGRADPDEIAAVIDAIRRDDLLLVISSDLSHFLSQEAAEALDRETVAFIERGEWQPLDGDNACGFLPIAGYLASHGAAPLRCIDQCTSAEASGDRSRVVGYASFVAYGP